MSLHGYIIMKSLLYDNTPSLNGYTQSSQQRAPKSWKEGKSHGHNRTNSRQRSPTHRNSDRNRCFVAAGSFIPNRNIYILADSRELLILAASGQRMTNCQPRVRMKSVEWRRWCVCWATPGTEIEFLAPNIVTRRSDTVIVELVNANTLQGSC